MKNMNFVILGLLLIVSFSFATCVNISDTGTWGTALANNGTYVINESVTLCTVSQSID